MTLRRAIGWGTAALAAAAAALLVFGGDGDAQIVKVPLQTAGGLRPGSQVKVAGVPVGDIAEIKLDDHDVPVATLEIDPKKASIGRDAAAEIVTSNLLGSKFVSLEPGRRGGSDTVTIPASRITYPTDIDELLDTLDADTRTRLQILLNELGYALTGRRTDFREALRLLPRDLDAGGDLIADLAADNETLGRLVGEAGRTIHTYNGERDDLNRLIDNFGLTLQTTADKRAELADTLAQAPATLRTAQAFLTDLERTAVPLGPAARTLAATAPELNATLAEVPAFEAAARPALAKAVEVAPSLNRLAARGTPVIRRAVPTLRALAAFAGDAAPLAHALRVSIDDVLGTVEGWARAIQTRDGFSHVFRGRLTFGAEFFRSIINAQSGGKLIKQLRKDTRTRRPPVTTPAPAGPAPLPKPGAPLLQQTLDRLPKLDDLTKGVKPTVDQVLKDTGSLIQQQKPLLDYLLGK